MSLIAPLRTSSNLAIDLAIEWISKIRLATGSIQFNRNINEAFIGPVDPIGLSTSLSKRQKAELAQRVS